ncbi:hypothetical protein Taro_027527 [Colocasia esculenta]|uniref:Pectinesterase inhibitor domain-containing protein n=1 Tax=Colocasia esculenta TaxID=4460 RepID=A0A843VFX6_COLES|nr:hypothetical protein [Colocasia esculenta]
MATMAFYITLFLLLLASSAIATVEEVCKTASQDPEIKYDFCVSSLKAAPGSATADNQGLAVIAGTLTANQAKSIKSKVDSLLKSATDAKVRECLSTCQEAFDDAISDAEDGTTAAKEKQLEDAKAKFSAVIDAPSTCEDGFKEFHLQSPLTQDGDTLEELAAIALSIISGLN